MAPQPTSSPDYTPDWARTPIQTAQTSVPATATPDWARTPTQGGPQNTEDNSILGKVNQLADKTIMPMAETGAHILSGIPAFVGAAGASIGHLLTDAPGLRAKNAADAANRTAEALTYRPKNPIAAAASEGIDTAASYLGPKEGAALRDLALKYGVNPYVAASLEVGTNALPNLLGGFKAAGAGKVVRPLSPEAALAGKEGMGITPMQANAGPVLKGLTSVANRAELERVLSERSVEKVDEAAREEAGIPEGAYLGKADDPSKPPQAITDAKKPHNAVYTEVKQLPDASADPRFEADIDAIPDKMGSGGFGLTVPQSVYDLMDKYRAFFGIQKNFKVPGTPGTPGTPASTILGPGGEPLRAATPGTPGTPGGTVSITLLPAMSLDRMMNDIRALRRDAYSRFNGRYSPADVAMGHAQLGIANALDGLIERHIQAQPSVDPTLFPRYIGARTALAKINAVEDSLVGPHVDAGELLKQQEMGKPLSGRLANVAYLKQNFDRSLQRSSAIRQNPVSYFDAVIGGGAATGSAMMGEAPRVTAGLLGGILGRPFVRQALASDLMQKYLTRPDSLRGTVASKRQKYVSGVNQLGRESNAQQ